MGNILGKVQVLKVYWKHFIEYIQTYTVVFALFPFSIFLRNQTQPIPVNLEGNLL